MSLSMSYVFTESMRLRYITYRTRRDFARLKAIYQLYHRANSDQAVVNENANKDMTL